MWESERQLWTDRRQERQKLMDEGGGMGERGSPQRHGEEGLIDSSASDGLPQQLSAALPIC